ncbi:GNAT family N-acetyltransferase [Christiangramia marina]|uniref:GNAT family N-acetyltransferase n=1 Tax=Christiangramia marina TaxID=409436 RepID=UPI003AA99243
MDIRKATDADIPEILQVLKASLGETSSKKSEEVWRYKHIDNPFGRSLVLLAIEDSKIIGVRALMRWKWQRGDRKFSAYRAVDTATHPDHQGKGIFKKLTLKAIEIAKAEEGDFVFNTPNNQSKPGYLKMGWQTVSKLNVNLKPVNPIYWFNSSEQFDLEVKIQSTDEELNLLLFDVNLNSSYSDQLFTPKNREFLRWRYESNPLQNYNVKATKNYYIASYVKSQGKMRELRIVEVLMKNNNKDQRDVKADIKRWIKTSGVQFISYSSRCDLNYGLSHNGNHGPELTIRKLNLDSKSEDDLLELQNWSYSLGDLELF